MTFKHTFTMCICEHKKVAHRVKKLEATKENGWKSTERTSCRIENCPCQKFEDAGEKRVGYGSSWREF